MTDVNLVLIDKEVQTAFKRLEHAAVDLSPAMRKIAQTMATVTEDNFAAEGRPKWQALSDATKHMRIGGNKAYKKNGELKASAKRLQEAGFKILQHTGALASSITTDYSSRDATIGSNLIYAAIQHFGGQAGPGLKVTIPAREYMPIDADGNLQPEAKQAVLDTVLRHLQSSVGI